MDEASLTGETVPIPKFKLEDYTKVEQKSHWVDVSGDRTQTTLERFSQNGS